MLDLCQQIYTTKTVVWSFKETLKTPLHTWPLCFASRKWLRNPSELCSPSPVCPVTPSRCHLPVLSLAVWEPRRSSASAAFPPSRVWETDNECFPLCLLLLSSFISQNSPANKGPLIHPDNQLTLLLLCFYLCRRTSSRHLCSQRTGRRIKVSRFPLCSVTWAQVCSVMHGHVPPACRYAALIRCHGNQ